MTIEITGLNELIRNMDNFVKYNATASRQALNDTGRKARTAALKLTREDWNIKAADLKKVSKLKLAKNSNLTLTFEMDSHSLPLKLFAKEYVTGRTPTGKRRKGGAGVKYKLKKKQRGYKTLGGNSFIKASKFNGGRLEVFTRRRSPRGAPITAQYSITPTSMFDQRGAEKFIETFSESFANRYGHYLRRNGII